jgi:putative transposase
LKQTLNMEPLCTKSPEMVRKEIWAHWLAYNLIRKAMAQAALAGGILPRQISFAGARQLLAAAWHRLSREPRAVQDGAQLLWKRMVQWRIGRRPNRVEPRVVKRRPKKQRLMMKPRKELQEELLARKSLG